MTGSVTFAPLLPWPVIAAAVGFAGVLLAIALVRRGRGAGFRAAALAVLALAVANPRLVSEERLARPDVAVVVVDRSASQAVGERTTQADTALRVVKERLARFDDLEVKVVEAAADRGGEGGTRLMEALSGAMTDIPRSRFAGAIMITDGQVHDVPASPKAASPGGPVHVLLTGAPGEKDRRLTVERAPGYGIVGNKVTIAYKVEDRQERGPRATRGLARVRFVRNGTETSTALVPIGQTRSYSFVLDHAGPTIVELQVEPAEGELSLVNNRAVVSISGVRERLRVLLVSGQPHAGERTWRNLLKSDPSVDLVHFTILRPPEKSDATPLKEISLIAFPIQELFESKLNEFDLIVFDRYVVRHVLPPSYLRNIENYVRGGGALLMAVGPEFSGMFSLYRTSLGRVMPGEPTGKVLEGAFRPELTGVGRRHPVTAALLDGKGATPKWGRWFRQIDARARTGMVLMKGRDGKPLLILNRVGKGRVAQFLSDHIWLWARGYDGGGPQVELLRRLAHWLMKEPDLEEEALKVGVKDGRMTIERRSLAQGETPVTVTAPSGAERTVVLKALADGRAVAQVPASEDGLWRVNDGDRTALAVAGELNPLELADLWATGEKLAPLARATGGGIAWIADGIPDLRRTKPGRDASGRGWLGLRRNDTYVVVGVAETSLLPGVLVLVLVLGGLAAAWWREGR